ncbi:hypothetical protein ALC57_14831 [Trachymyrmex cornetzi]|uniref:Uncharacterized protein n=1 Tax=Trachymyrmex cornetzi TaxID=471704 RepID=A0A151IXL1_9HYME|nr:hypothetical protein ALC57_14831 [Trachymyrmex cornetzi]
MMTVLAVGAGDVGGSALSVVQVYCSSDTKQSVYKVAAAFVAEKAKPVGDERDGIEEARESQWYQRVGIVYTELIKTSPFNTPFPLASSRTNTRTAYEIYTHIIPPK